MILGIFAKTFVRPCFEAGLDAAKTCGAECVQFNLACVGLPTLPEAIEPMFARRIASELAERALFMAAISGTGNLIHPDPARRRAGVARLQILIESCRDLGTRVVTLCTGSRDPDDMWHSHPENDAPAAWQDLVEALETLLPFAESNGVVLGVEPEPANVIADASRARRLLDDLKSPALKIVFDGANLLLGKDAALQQRVLSEAIALLGPDIILAHAKDLSGNLAQPFAAAGKGMMDYGLYLSLLHDAGFDGPIILHGLDEAEAPGAVAFLKTHLSALAVSSRAQTLMPYFEYDRLRFHYLERGSGLPFFFQHGLGGDTERVFDLVALPNSFRLLGMDCRAHGRTTPLGDPAKLRFDSLADDLIALMDHLQIPRAVIGGTSMGAGVALNCALRHPDRLQGLVLLRPAWLDRPNEQNAQVFGLIASSLREHGPDKGAGLFEQTAVYNSILRESSDTANSLLALFTDPRATETVARLESIPCDAPNHDRAEWGRIAVPTLVLANRCDPIHPFEYGEALAAGIPHARLIELTPKSVSLPRYTTELRQHLADFLQTHFAASG